LTQGDQKDDRPLSIGRAVQLTREQKALSAGQLADITEIPLERIVALEAGQFDPSYELVLELANGLKTRISTLIVLAEQLDASSDAE
jgi:transcriptional regulator with XRE-family HTH domain